MTEELENLLGSDLQKPKPRIKPKFAILKKFRLSLFEGRTLLAVLVFLVVLGVFIVLPAVNTLVSAKETYQEVLKVKDGYQNQDLEAMGQSLSQTKEKLSTTQGRFNYLKWSRFIPFLGRYWDAGILLLKRASRL